MSEFQYDFMGNNGSDIKWELIQFRITAESKRDIQLWCNDHQIPLSVLLRLVINKMINNCRELPGVVNKAEPTDQVNIATNEVIGYLPVIKKQREINRRMY